MHEKTETLYSLLNKILDTPQGNSLTMGQVNKQALGAKSIKRFVGLSLANHSGFDLKLCSDVMQAIDVDYGCLLVEIATALKDGVFIKENVEKAFESFGKQIANANKEPNRYKQPNYTMLAKFVLIAHGVYYKAASKGKDGSFTEAINRWYFYKYPILNSVYSLSKNKTTKRIPEMQDHIFPELVAHYIVTRNCLNNSTSRRYTDKVLNLFLHVVQDKLRCNFGVTYLAYRGHITGKNPYDKEVNSYSVQIIDCIFKTLVTKNKENAKPIAGLLEQRRDSLAKQMGYHVQHKVAEKERYAQMRRNLYSGVDPLHPEQDVMLKFATMFGTTKNAPAPASLTNVTVRIEDYECETYAEAKDWHVKQEKERERNSDEDEEPVIIQVDEADII